MTTVDVLLYFHDFILAIEMTNSYSNTHHFYPEELLCVMEASLQ
jgi:hypothetical protein